MTGNIVLNETLKEVEARRHQRAEFETLKTLLASDMVGMPVRISTKKKGNFAGSLINISKSGIQVSARKLLTRGDRIKISFMLNTRVIASNAVTIWSKRAGGGCWAGLEFQYMPDNMSDFLYDLIAVIPVDANVPENNDALQTIPDA